MMHQKILLSATLVTPFRSVLTQRGHMVVTLR
jgi:hypothetical protein